MRRASASGSFGKPARIQSAWKARSARPTGRPAATPRAIRSAPPIGSLGSGASARNRPAAAKAVVRGRGLRLGVRQRERVARRLASGGEQEGSQALERWRRLDPVQGDQGRRGGPEPAGFRVGESQPLARPLRVLFDRNGERGQPQDRVRPAAPRGFDRDKAAQAPRIADAAEDRLEEAALAHRPHDLARAGRDEELDQFGAHPLARQPRQGHRAPRIAAARPSRSSPPAAYRAEKRKKRRMRR